MNRPAVLPVLILALAAAHACGPGDEQQPRTDEEPGSGIRVEAYGDMGALRLTSIPEPRVVAYVSMDRLEVYVDRDFRDRASWLLNAHISVSTWHWRIPLPGDDPGIPITPGDEEREFEELDLSLWDRSEPGMDDIRIVLAEAVPADRVVSCAEVSGDLESAWISAQLTTPQSRVSETETTRQDFHLLGSGEVFPTPSCTGESVRSVPLVGWGQRPAA